MLRVSLEYSILNDIMPPVKPQPKRGYSSAKRRRCEQLLEARAAKEPALEPALEPAVVEPGLGSTTLASSTPVTVTDTVTGVSSVPVM